MNVCIDIMFFFPNINRPVNREPSDNVVIFGGRNNDNECVI